MLRNSPFNSRRFSWDLSDPLPADPEALMSHAHACENYLRSVLPANERFDVERLRRPCGTAAMWVRFETYDRCPVTVRIEGDHELTWAEVLWQLQRHAKDYNLGSHVFVEDFIKVPGHVGTYQIFQGS